MKVFFKILLVPITLIVSILIAFFTFLLGVGTFLSYLLMILFVLGAIISFISQDVKMAIVMIIVAFILSPYGLPTAGAYIIAFLKKMNDKIKTI